MLPGFCSACVCVCACVCLLTTCKHYSPIRVRPQNNRDFEVYGVCGSALQFLNASLLKTLLGHPCCSYYRSQGISVVAHQCLEHDACVANVAPCRPHSNLLVSSSSRLGFAVVPNAWLPGTETMRLPRILFANWSPPCRVLVENVSEWFSVFFLFYRCVLGFAVLLS